MPSVPMSYCPHLSRVRRTRLGFGLALLLAVTGGIAGCITAPEVAKIVAQSNAAMLAGQLGGLPSPEGKSGNAESLSAASARIDAFVEAHADQKQVVAPLRIRQAMLLLAHQQFNSARSAFDAASIGDLVTARDQALKRNQAHLLWWFAASGKKIWTAEDFAAAGKALDDLKAEHGKLTGSPEIRDYLGELRAWIGVTHAGRSTSPDRARALLVDALDQYANLFTPAELELIATDQNPPGGETSVGQELRRRLRAKAVLATARKINMEAGLSAQPTTGVFARMIN